MVKNRYRINVIMINNRTVPVKNKGKARLQRYQQKKHLPSINNQHAIAINCLVLLFFITNEIRQSNKRQMRSGTHVTESKIPQKKKDELKRFFKDSHEACEDYYACLSINELGLISLDPVKCKAKNFDPKKVAKEQEKRILLFTEKVDKIKEEKGSHFVRKVLRATLDYSNTLPLPYNYLHGPDPEIPHPDNPSVDKAIQLIGYKIKLYNDDVEVIAVKITKNGIFFKCRKKCRRRIDSP
ncbi:hypothetical protein C1646_745765 [Rhizophagus diaphanus]|nr:hypothetical protein C1646_745765 [Rhizophagus diaphanus] [Rhizophagus sp. MUCL 43196]